MYLNQINNRHKNEINNYFDNNSTVNKLLNGLLIIIPRLYDPKNYVSKRNENNMIITYTGKVYNILHVYY